MPTGTSPISAKPASPTIRDSWEAIKAFAGEDPGIARYYPEDDAFLLEKPERVEHYEVPYSSMSPAG
jgi:hypothetical protein